jgi:cell filamentation protein
MSTLNAIHPFREGNGRPQMTFLLVLASEAGHPITLTNLNPAIFLDAMIESFFGREEALVEQIRRLIR